MVFVEKGVIARTVMRRAKAMASVRGRVPAAPRQRQVFGFFDLKRRPETSNGKGFESRGERSILVQERDENDKLGLAVEASAG